MSEKFDFASMLDAQFGGIRKGYKFGKAFNDDKSLVRPEKKTVVVDSVDNETLKRAFLEGEVVSGVVDKETKGGYEVTVAGARTFCPFSQIDRFRQEGAEYIGRKFEFLVTDYSVDDRGLNVVVSRRKLLEQQAEAIKEARLAELTEGETVNGTVARLMDFGAFVDLDGVQGLVPMREIAWERVDDLKSLLKEGDPITVKILHIDRETGKISLSRKECISRVFKRTPEEEAAAKSAAEVAAWMHDNSKKNAAFGTGAFDAL